MGKGNDPNCARNGGAMQIAPAVIEGSNLQYQVEYEYASDYSCHDSGCDDGPCRCGTISDAQVTEIDVGLLGDLYRKQIRNAFPADKKQEMERYAVREIIEVARLRSDDFEVVVSPGYYGEEIDGVYLDRSRAMQLDHEVSDFLGLPQDKLKQTMWLLCHKNGRPPAETLGVSSCSITSVAVSRLAFPDFEPEKVPGQVESYRSPLSKLPVGVVVEQGDGSYLVVDGHRHLQEAKDAERTRVKVIALR